MKLIVAVFFVFGLCSIASAGPITEKLRTCLVIDDMTKERLECYVLIPLDVAHDSGMISPTVPI